MKKKKILSAFAALAVAVCSVITPVQKNNGLNIEASASATNGISFAPVGGSNLSALNPNDKFTVKLVIPAGDIDENIDILQLYIDYESDVFVVDKWYATSSADATAAGYTYAAIPDTIPAAAHPTAGVVTPNSGTSPSPAAGHNWLAISAASDDTIINLQSTGLVLDAVFKVRDDTDVDGGPHTIKLVTSDGSYFFGYHENATKVVNIWDPDEDDITGSVRVSNSISGKITGIDCSANTVRVSIMNGSTEVAWDNCTAEGNFTIQEVPETGTGYTLKVSVWSVFVKMSKSPDGIEIKKPEVDTASNKIKSNTGIINIAGSKKKRALGTIIIRQYGDVNNDNSVDINDATQILRFIVGNSSLIKDDSSADNTNMNKAMANVLDTDSYINAKDATQIMRKIVGKTSVFSTNA